MPMAPGKHPRAGRITSPPIDPRRWPANPKGTLLSRAGLQIAQYFYANPDKPFESSTWLHDLAKAMADF